MVLGATVKFGASSLVIKASCEHWRIKNGYIMNQFFCMIFVVFCIFSYCPANSQEIAHVTKSDGQVIDTYMFKPKTEPPYPTILALHGCGGIKNNQGDFYLSYQDWINRFTNLGYMVVYPDSFGSRGLGSVCDIRDRPITTRDRSRDVTAVANWLESQTYFDKNRVYLIGWSNGGETALQAVWREKPEHFDYKKVAIFYPGCRGFEKAGWFSRVPLTIFHGQSDDWTPIEPCLELSQKHKFDLIAYPNAYHSFDHPNLKIRERTAAYTTRSDGMVTMGTNLEARTDAIKRVLELFRD